MITAGDEQGCIPSNIGQGWPWSAFNCFSTGSPVPIPAEVVIYQVVITLEREETEGAMRMLADAISASVHAAASKSLEDSQSGAVHFFANTPVLAGFFSFALAQSLKVFTTWYKEKRLDWKRLLGPGGMPSSHSATVMALVVAIGLRDGPGSSLFAIAVVLAAVVMYDASGVRLQAGRQAEVLNQIVYELPPEHPLSDSRPLRDMLGHTPPQVAAGALLGCVLAYMLHLSDWTHL